MSASEGNHAGHADGAHHGPPPPPEPKTPMWLPAVGAVLFLTVGLVWGLSGPSKDATSTENAAPAASATAAADAGAAAPRH